MSVQRILIYKVIENLYICIEAWQTLYGRHCMPCSANFRMTLETVLFCFFNINFRVSLTNNFSQILLFRVKNINTLCVLRLM